jgi:hypothetical protein
VNSNIGCFCHTGIFAVRDDVDIWKALELFEALKGIIRAGVIHHDDFICTFYPLLV